MCVCDRKLEKPQTTTLKNRHTIWKRVINAAEVKQKLKKKTIGENENSNKPKSGGKSTEFGAGDFISAAMGPRRTVGVHACCLTPIL